MHDPLASAGYVRGPCPYCCRLVGGGRIGAHTLFAQVAACGLQIKVGTSHLESPCPPFKGESMYGKQRRLQLSSAIEALTPPPPPDEGPEGGAGGGRGGRGGATGMPAPARTPSSQAT